MITSIFLWIGLIYLSILIGKVFVRIIKSETKTLSMESLLNETDIEHIKKQTSLNGFNHDESNSIKENFGGSICSSVLGSCKKE